MLCMQDLTEPLRLLAGRLALLPTFVRLLLARAVANGRLAARDLLGGHPVVRTPDPAVVMAGANDSVPGGSVRPGIGAGIATADPAKAGPPMHGEPDGTAASEVAASLGAAVVVAAAEADSALPAAAAGRDQALAPGTELAAGSDDSSGTELAAEAGTMQQQSQSSAEPASQQAAAGAADMSGPPWRWVAVPQLGTMLHPDTPLQQAGHVACPLQQMLLTTVWWHDTCCMRRAAPRASGSACEVCPFEPCTAGS